MLRKIILCLALFFCFNLFAAQNIVQGPFPLKGLKEVSIELMQNNDKSVTLRKSGRGNGRVIDTYEVGDGVPKVETVFFYSVSGQKNIVILVSWDEENVNAIHYKVYAYHYNETGDIYKNNDITNDKTLEGYDGYSGSGATFDYKNALSIKKYLDSKYNKGHNS